MGSVKLLLSQYYARKHTEGFTAAKKIVFDILADVTDRSELRQEWDQFDADTKEGVLRDWLEIVEGHLNNERPMADSVLQDRPVECETPEDRTRGLLLLGVAVMRGRAETGELVHVAGWRRETEHMDSNAFTEWCVQKASKIGVAYK